VTTAYRLTPKAREGFHRIAFYVEERFGREVAERVVTDLEKGFEGWRRIPTSATVERTSPVTSAFCSGRSGRR
jgi:plasmid stabilization system protein ParE